MFAKYYWGKFKDSPSPRRHPRRGMISHKRKCAEARNGVLPVTAMIWATNFCLLLIFVLRSKQIFVFCSLLRWGTKKFLFGAYFCVGERKNFCLVLAFALGNEKIFVRCLLLRWGAKKFLFGACFYIGEATNFCLFAVFVSGQATNFCLLLAFALDKQRYHADCIFSCIVRLMSPTIPCERGKNWY